MNEQRTLLGDAITVPGAKFHARGQGAPINLQFLHEIEPGPLVVWLGIFDRAEQFRLGKTLREGPLEVSLELGDRSIRTVVSYERAELGGEEERRQVVARVGPLLGDHAAAVLEHLHDRPGLGAGLDTVGRGVDGLGDLVAAVVNVARLDSQLTHPTHGFD